MQVTVFFLIYLLPCQELVTDPDREASLVSHTSELAQLATEMDLLAIFKTRNNRIKATLETMESDLLASGKAGVEKRGSRYHIDGRIRPDLMKLQGIIMSFLGDTRTEEIQDKLIQRGFRVSDLNVWKYYADSENRSLFLKQQMTEYFLARNTDPKITREFFDTENRAAYLKQNPELLVWTDEEYLAYNALEHEAAGMAQINWASTFLTNLAPRSRKVVIDFVLETVTPHARQSFGYGLLPSELDLIQSRFQKIRKDWELQP